MNADRNARNNSYDYQWYQKMCKGTVCPFHKLFLRDLLRRVGLISRLVDLRQHRRHGEERQEQCYSGQHQIGRGLLGAHCGAEEGKGDDVSTKGGHHHHQRRCQRDQRGDKDDLQSLNTVTVDIDETVSHRGTSCPLVSPAGTG